MKHSKLGRQKPGHPKFSCGFCKDRFRSRRQRNKHTNSCKK